MTTVREAVILIVDDDDITFYITERMFKSRGIVNVPYHVNSGERAIDFLLKRNGFEDAPRPDIVYLDFVMPRMRGTEVLEYIKKSPELADIPVIMLTGTDSYDVMDIAQEQGAVGYMLKPLTIEKLIESYVLVPDMRLKFVMEEEK